MAAGIDPDRLTYTPLADLPTATEKARRGFGLGSRLVDRYRGRLKGDIKYLVRMPVQGVVGRKVLYRYSGDLADLGLRLKRSASFAAD